MTQHAKFRRLLPILQTPIAAIFGGYGMWQRNAILSQPFFGSTLRESTAVFHVWPWPWKFAVVLNMPAFLGGALLYWPMAAFRPDLPDWTFYPPALFCVAALWYCVGLEFDRRVVAAGGEARRKWYWTAVTVFAGMCAASSAISTRIGSYTSYLPIGIVVWIFAAIAMTADGVHNRRPNRKKETRSAT